MSNNLNVERLLMAALLVSVGVGTALPFGRTAAAEQEESPRYARRVTPPETDWAPESEVRSAPQVALYDVIWEVNLFPPDSEPTPRQRRAAERLVERSYESAEEHDWFDVARGAADGYAPMYDSLTHWANEEYILDDAVLDPDRPEFLMYYSTPRGTKLVGYMFLAREAGAHGPQIGGPLTVWHDHVFSRDYCLLEGLVLVGQPEDGACRRGDISRRSPEMIHVWLIDHPDGQFASQMSIERNALMSALERRYQERGY